MPNRHPRIAVFTLSYKEDIMLPLWVNHYSQLVGRENLLILDHSNDPAITIEGVKTERIARPNLDEITNLNTIKIWQKKLLETYDWVIFTDNDEFIIFRQYPSITIYDYLKNKTDEIIRCIGIDVIDSGNIPTIDWKRPILKQRNKGIISSWSCKPAISSVTNNWNPGFHTTNSVTTIDPNFWLFHLKYADETYLMQRLAMTRSFEWSEESIKAGYGGSHRVSDYVMTRHLDQMRSNQQNGTLDDFLKTSPDLNHVSSPLMDIPQDFISLL